MVEEAPVSIMADFATKLKDVEERLNMLKERLMLLNRTFLKEMARLNSEILTLKESARSIKEDMEKVKEGLEHIMRESAGLVRKEELNALQRFMRLWEPLKFVREEDVKRMIAEALKREKA